MCLAIPMKLVEIKSSGIGVTELNGAKYDVDLSITPDVEQGDYLIVHAGFAIEKLDRKEADERIKLFEGMAAMYKSDGEQE